MVFFPDLETSKWEWKNSKDSDFHYLDEGLSKEYNGYWNNRERDVPSFDFETSKTPKIVISITLMKVWQRSIIVSKEW